MVKESKYLDEIKVGLIFMVKMTIWLRTVALAEVCALRVLSSFIYFYLFCTIMKYTKIMNFMRHRERQKVQRASLKPPCRVS